MRPEMNLLETWTLPENHPLKQAEREKAKQWQVDFSRENELGGMAVQNWIVLDSSPSIDLELPEAA